ncbi:hypothetical protein GJW-30_1_02429 [Variibacter gotjawalensis]|uniref:Uncharacterized protein n=1 Tax=Variibacter gotjawalensis TaxID=1333996 RepID=A0A0S3PVA4_9BRAD|nr:hypothetical protein [Variibacter gotjawalensis]NIK45716.1 hypothetical protein [Variibacter gotjawalensis]RZS47642.1 hypothetical protein EV661_0032 [Variibacter gotjawalensis]BAT59894.1 hypothetical protein GJW-30_1_02429 [Variibacter gotjawalensis]
MTSDEKIAGEPPEIKAISAVYAALKTLDPQARLRVLRYSSELLGLDLSPITEARDTAVSLPASEEGPSQTSFATSPPLQEHSDDTDGINAVALRWIKRNDLDTKSLQKLFSLGVEEIDLVARSVPGRSKRERMRNVMLLKGVAAYLGTGVARISHDQLKEACMHYNAYDSNNSAAYLKEFSPEVSGSKESGFTLTARGLTLATDLVRELIGGQSSK